MDEAKKIERNRYCKGKKRGKFKDRIAALADARWRRSHENKNKVFMNRIVYRLHYYRTK